MAVGGGRAQGSIHMFLICHWWEQGQSGAMLGGTGEAGTGGERAGCSCCCWEVWLQGGMEGESARKKGWDLGTRAVSWGRREQVVTCLSAQLFCVQEPERDRSSWEEKKQRGQGPSWSFCLSHRF